MTGRPGESLQREERGFNLQSTDDYMSQRLGSIRIVDIMFVLYLV